MSIDSLSITPNPVNTGQRYVISVDVSPREPTSTTIIPIGHYETENGYYMWVTPGKAYDQNEITRGTIADNRYGNRNSRIYFRVPLSSVGDIVAIKAEMLLQSNTSTSPLTLEMCLTAGSSATNQTQLVPVQTVTLNTTTKTWFTVEWTFLNPTDFDGIKANANNLCLEMFAQRPTSPADRYCYETRIVVQEWK